jgi:hypothetical protein
MDAQLQEIQVSISKAVNRIAQRNPSLCREELRGESWIVALEALPKWNPAKSSLSTYTFMVVHRFLAGNCRWRAWKRRYCKQAGVPLSEVQATAGFDLGELLGEVSSEAREAIVAALECGNKGWLIETLTADFGWEKAEIARVWSEIREALQGG